MGAPWAAVPSPGGKPVPSASISISQRATSAGRTGTPRWGLPGLAPAANADGHPNSHIQTHNSPFTLGIGMGHLSMAVHGPAGDDVAMMIFEGKNRRSGIELPAGGDKFRARRLEGTMVVPGAALQNDGTAIPAPWHAKAGESVARNRLLQSGFTPAFATIGGNHHLCDFSLAGIGNPGNLIEAGLLQIPAWRWPGDEGFDLVQEIEVVAFS